MKTFNDNQNRQWTIEINVNALKSVKAALDIDLMEISGGNLIERLTTDFVLLIDVIYVLCRKQADALSIGDEEFGRAMVGDAIENATIALLEGITDFFPSRRRATLKKAMSKMEKLDLMAMEIVNEKLDGNQMEEELKKKIELVVGNSFTNSPVSSALTPDR